MILRSTSRVLNTIFHDYGHLSSPILTFMTYINQQNMLDLLAKSNKYPDFFLGVEEYWTFIKNGYNTFNSICDKYGFRKQNKNYEYNMVLDCANGVESVFENEIRQIFTNKESLEVFIEIKN